MKDKSENRRNKGRFLRRSWFSGHALAKPLGEGTLGRTATNRPIPQLFA
jgi:hypothetical protein